MYSLHIHTYSYTLIYWYIFFLFTDLLDPPSLGPRGWLRWTLLKLLLLLSAAPICSHHNTFEVRRNMLKLIKVDLTFFSSSFFFDEIRMCKHIALQDVAKIGDTSTNVCYLISTKHNGVPRDTLLIGPELVSLCCIKLAEAGMRIGRTE